MQDPSMMSPADLDSDLVRLFRCICSRIDYNATIADPHNASTSGDHQHSEETDLNLTDWTFEDSDVCGTGSTPNDHFRYIEELLLTRVIVTICVFGLLGNVGNLLVLVPQARHCAMGRIERSVHWGLTSLAVSDFFFCLAVIPKAFTDRDPIVLESDFSLFYSVYGDALINVFILASTWLTVAMAVGRYLAVCHPFRAREIIGITVAKRAVFFIYGASVLCNAPRFFVHRVERFQCATAEFFFRWSGYVNIKTHAGVEKGYMWGYFIIGIVLPCALLSFSNAFLIRALRQAHTQLRLNRASMFNPVDQYRPITLTLVALIVMYIVLVSPAEMAIFLRHRLADDVPVDDDTYGLLAAVGNTLQAVNFSVNFVLYYVINVHFRRALFRLVRSRCRQRADPYANTSLMTGSISLNPGQRHDCDRMVMDRVKTVLPVGPAPEEV